MFKKHSWEYKLLSKSKEFNKKWYLQTYPDVAKAKVDPIEHYINHGWKEGRNPGPTFNTVSYLTLNSDVRNANINPLIHWERFGRQEGRNTGTNYGQVPKQQNKTGKFVDTVIFPKDAKKYTYDTKNIKTNKKYKRIAVFASYSGDGTIADYVVYYLKELKKVCDAIVFVADNPIIPAEAEKIKDIVIYAQFERHNEYDFGSYKRGYMWLKKQGLLKCCDELLICNDSCYGPVYPFKDVFDKMAKKDCDFWGMLSNTEIQYHLQSYFLNFKCNVFNSDCFDKFMTDIHRQESVQQVFLQYETKLTQILNDAGFKSCAFIESADYQGKHPHNIHSNFTFFPKWLMSNGMPLIKLKAILQYGRCNFESLTDTLDFIQKKNKKLFDVINSHNNGVLLPHFSIIVPTYNRKNDLVLALYSVLAQTYQNFEVIVVDDGSTDNTMEHLQTVFPHELKTGKIRYFYKQNGGCCAARNYALERAKNDWIAYLDSDNVLLPDFLDNFVTHIYYNYTSKCLYCNFVTYKQRRVGQAFDLNKLLQANFIDLGTFVHHKSVYDELGGFDTNMTRLVDWELIIRYTKKYTPVYINKACLLYNDIYSDGRITISANYYNNLNYVRKKHTDYPTVTTVITTYNHEKYIEQALESAVKQSGRFIHEILVSDDGSTDGTRKIIKRYCDAYPYLIKDISPKKNLGISKNLKHCFRHATGKYIAILEGDDYWTSDKKLEKQMNFMEQNKESSMVFSRVRVFNEKTQKSLLLDRHNNLPTKLTGSDFIKEPSLIANFSCCLFKGEFMKKLPAVLYKHRLSEIPLAFYLERFGNIGFIGEILSVYRQHENGVWSGADKIRRLESGLNVRLNALAVCSKKYQRALKNIIETDYISRIEELKGLSQKHAGPICHNKNKTHKLKSYLLFPYYLLAMLVMKYILLPIRKKKH